MQTNQTKIADNVVATDIGLSEETRREIVYILNTVLADEHLLYTKTRNYHWNVTGPHFTVLHELFEEQYNALKLYIDEIAERARMLGGFAIGTLSEFQSYTRMTETPAEYPDARMMLARLLDDHESLIKHIRSDVDRLTDELGDEGTADLLIEIMQYHEETAWMLRAMLQDSEATP